MRGDITPASSVVSRSSGLGGFPPEPDLPPGWIPFRDATEAQLCAALLRVRFASLRFCCRVLARSEARNYTRSYRFISSSCLPLQEAVRRAIDTAADANADAEQLRTQHVAPLLSEGHRPTTDGAASGREAEPRWGAAGIYGPLGMRIDPQTGRPVPNERPTDAAGGGGIGMPAFAAVWSVESAATRNAPVEEGGASERPGGSTAATMTASSPTSEGGSTPISGPVYRTLLTHGAIFLKHRSRGPPRSRCVSWIPCFSDFALWLEESMMCGSVWPHTCRFVWCSLDLRTVYWRAVGSTTIRGALDARRIESVLPGCVTPSFQLKQKEVKDSNACFSLATAQRALDLEVRE